MPLGDSILTPLALCGTMKMKGIKEMTARSLVTLLTVSDTVKGRFTLEEASQKERWPRGIHSAESTSDTVAH